MCSHLLNSPSRTMAQTVANALAFGIPVRCLRVVRIRVKLQVPVYLAQSVHKMTVERQTKPQTFENHSRIFHPTCLLFTSCLILLQRWTLIEKPSDSLSFAGFRPKPPEKR
ncbi:hypothetical protein CEXT_58061 [Caerostris extrusa]|uniref:Uncharacterized protein n=1 Tax=Caerostris extrusa TaxID=172846 RepID=A0AAV4WQW9_CAEEX|nr:hypothetical protein CEXT_58061 [Caerostris extrusa]